VNEGLDIFQEWRVADRAAHAAEQRVMREAMASLDGRAAAPTVEVKEAAHRLRAVANDLFAVAMAELKRRSDQLRQ
jgi:hypothetical protein